jgi:hypothetical protein
MRSYPGALCQLVYAIAVFTSVEEKGLMGRDSWHGTSRKAEIAASVGWGMECGVNTRWR